MATCLQDLRLKLQTNQSALVEEIFLAQGTVVHIAKEWDQFYLIKDKEGHFYTVRKTPGLFAL